MAFGIAGPGIKYSPNSVHLISYVQSDDTTVSNLAVGQMILTTDASYMELSLSGEVTTQGDAITDIQGRSQNLPHYHPGTGLKFGVFGFSGNQNKNRISFAFVFACVVGKNPNTPI